jgi:hypothetical protein
MPYQMLCNDVQREGGKPSPDLASWLFCCSPLHNIWYGISNHVPSLGLLVLNLVKYRIFYNPKVVYWGKEDWE